MPFPRQFLRVQQYVLITISVMMIGCASSTPPALTSAKLYWNNRDYSAAREALESVIRDYPENTEARKMLGDIETFEGNWNEAIEQYQKIISLNTYHVPEAREGIDKVWQAVYDEGFNAGQEEDYRVAEELFRLCTDIIPERAPAWMNLAIIYMQLERYSDAVIAYEYILQINPREPNINMFIGFAHFQNENYEYAITYLEPIKTYHLSDLKFVKYLILSYLGDDETEKAKTLLNEAIERFPANREFAEFVVEIEEYLGLEQADLPEKLTVYTIVVAPLSALTTEYSTTIKEIFPRGLPIHGVTHPLNEIYGLAQSNIQFETVAEKTDIGMGPAFTIQGSFSVGPVPPVFETISNRYMVLLQGFLINDAGQVLWQQSGFPQGDAWTTSSNTEFDFILIDSFNRPTAGLTAILVVIGDPLIFQGSSETHVILGVKIISIN